MKEIPKWMLALAGISLAPVLFCPFYLFGGVAPFGTGTGKATGFLLYVLTQLLWVAPVVLFFVSLDFYRRGFGKTGFVLAAAGAALTAADVYLLF
ncbi:MAG TPA: hypothetical protein PLN34_10340 [Alloprevotella sp.]|nr:hypothetical protein [Alloprevotella sp.]